MGSVASIIDSTSEFFGHYWRSTVAGLPSPIAPLIRAVAPSLPTADLAASELAQLVETEIIPRLVQAHQLVPAAASPKSDATIIQFMNLTLTREVDTLIAFVDDRLSTGQSIDTLFEDLLGPTALLLGEYWNEDRISFTDVTIAVGRLQHLVRALNSRADTAVDEESARSAYFIPSASEQHTFGLFVLEDIFQRAGWRTWIETSATDDQTVGAVRSQWFDLLGISASRDSQIDEVAATIAAARRASRNPDLFILVGGRLFIEQPEIVSAVGADALATTGDQALLVADQVFMRRG
jgi:methanogenic corrinoid protein MtbC1